MRTLVLVAGDTASWAGPHLIATRGGGSDPSTIRNRPEQGFSYEHSVRGLTP